MRIEKNLRIVTTVVSFVVAFCLSEGWIIAASFTDSFTTGINPTNWVVLTNDPLFSVTAPGGSVVISKPSGNNSGFHYAIVACRIAARGDFTAQVTFTNANVALVSGSPGNQLQFDCRFGAQDFLIVRSDEQALGQNVHVYLNPPSVLEGTTSASATAGTLMITRAGTEVSGYLNSSLIYKGTLNTNDATFAFRLQNNGTDDAMSATYGNFQVTAVSLTNTPPNIQIQRQGTNCVVSWPDRSWPDYLSPNTLELTNNLSIVNLTNSWPTNSIMLSGDTFYSTNALSSGNGFFRLIIGPL